MRQTSSLSCLFIATNLNTCVCIALGGVNAQYSSATSCLQSHDKALLVKQLSPAARTLSSSIYLQANREIDVKVSLNNATKQQLVKI